MKKIIASIAILGPSVAFAQTTIIHDVNSLSATLTSLGNTVIEILIAFAVIYIIYNVIRFIMKADSPEERNVIGKAILFGIVGLFVILSIWGLVAILTNSFNTGNLNTPPLNQFPTIPPPTDVNTRGK